MRKLLLRPGIAVPLVKNPLPSVANGAFLLAVHNAVAAERQALRVKAYRQGFIARY